MRILVGGPEKGAQGGPAACEPPFVAELARLGHKVDEEIYTFADAHSSLRARVSRVRDTAQRFQERLSGGNFDLVHLNTSFDVRALLRDVAIVPRLSAQGSIKGSKGAKIFLKFHGSDQNLLTTRNPILVRLRKRLLAHADGIGVLSTEEQANFLRAGIPESKVFVVKNVVEENSQPRSLEFLSTWALPDNCPLLLFIGRFISRKGLLDVITASGLLRDDGRRFLLVCLGDGPARAPAEALVKRLRLEDYVRFFGYIPEERTASFYSNCDALLFPTYHIEGFPMVIFNAAAAGMPIITTRIRAAADYLQQPENCLWTEPRRPDLLCGRIAELLNSSALRRSMAVNNKQLAARFTAAIVSAEYVKIYEQITGRTAHAHQ